MRSTPQEVKISPRDRRFGRTDPSAHWWHSANPYASAFYNSLSATFPQGEAFFVESVRAFQKGADQKLASDIKAFTTQEVIHSREHLAFNKRSEASGYDYQPLDERVTARLAIAKARSPYACLAATMALEHFTAILAHELLANPLHLRGADPQSAALWRWHAVEEIEHKAVAYDTWLHATRAWSRWKRWKVKAQVMLLVTQHFIVDRTAGAMELLRQDGIRGLRAWPPLLWYMWIWPGMMRKIFGSWLAFFLPRFHPWNRDDHALIKLNDYAPTDGERRVRSAV
ncbi:MAG: metal-dependent hydrolase [Sphingomicrobium sp.]